MDPSERTARAAAPPGSTGYVLSLIRSGRAATRNELIAATGMSRSTILQRVNLLLASDLVRDGGSSRSLGGRPPAALSFNDRAGVVIAADLGASHGHVAVTDLGGRSLAERKEPIVVGSGPDAILEWLTSTVSDLLAEAGARPHDTLAAGVGLPGPVDVVTGRPVNPPIMPGWNGYPVAAALSEAFGAPALVDNDVNVMALGEHRARSGALDPLVFVKVATGIGAGVVIDGTVYRGLHGAAGDIGHIRAPVGSDAPCTCGGRGCIAALAAGPAVARALTAAGVEASGTGDVVRLVAEGKREAFDHVREAGRQLGEVLAGVVSLLAPGAIVVGGELSAAREPLLAGIREVVYQRSLPLVTGDLQILPSALGARAGVVGAATPAIEHVVAPAIVERLVAEHGGARAA
ncbi:MAG: ROK family protein [Solirubrobacteraceae bacterium]